MVLFPPNSSSRLQKRGKSLHLAEPKILTWLSSLEFYALYRASLERLLTPEEVERLQKWQEQHPYFALLHLAQARGQASQDDFFRAAIYAPDRSQLQQYVRGRLYWPSLVPDPALDMDPNPSSTVETAQVAPGFRHPAPLFVALDFAALSPGAKVPSLSFGLLPGPSASQAYLHQILTEKTLLHLKIVQTLRERLSRFRQEYQPEPVSPEHWPESYFSAEQKARQERRAALIDQFLAEKPRLNRPKPQPEVDAPTEAHAQAELSVRPDDNLVTETLARLLVRQGNYAEARRIYEQLRLRFPDKSAYFDAQIEKISEK